MATLGIYRLNMAPVNRYYSFLLGYLFSLLEWESSRQRLHLIGFVAYAYLDAHRCFWRENMNDSPALYNSLFFFFLDRSFLLRIKLQYGLFSLQSSEDLLSSPISVDWRKNCKFSLSGIRSDQIRSVAQSCPTLCNPMNRSTPGLPVHHQLLEFTHNVDILTHSDFSPHYEMILEINQDPRNLSLLWAFYLFIYLFFNIEIVLTMLDVCC